MRAIETSTWLYEWLFNQRFGVESPENYTFYSLMRGHVFGSLMPKMTANGIDVEPVPKTPADVQTVQERFDVQLWDSIRPEIDDVELCVLMVLGGGLQFSCLDSDKVKNEKPSTHERFILQVDDVSHPVFCLSSDKSIGQATLKEVILRKRNLGDSAGPAIVIVNHQRKRRLDRRNTVDVFDRSIVELAKSNEVALVTALDLVRANFSGIELKWAPKRLIQSIATPGRGLTTLPDLEFAGTVRKVYQKHSVLGIDLLAWTLIDKECALFLQLPEKLVRISIDSIEIEGVDQEICLGPVFVGIKTQLEKIDGLKEGISVYVLRRGFDE